jgi:hypothetical protein
MSETINSEVAVMIEDAGFADLVQTRLEQDREGMLECQIRIGEDGKPEKVFGPEDLLKGAKGWIIRILAKFGFLRPLV